LLNDAKLRKRLSANALKTAQKYSWEKVAQRVYDFYVQTLDKRPAQK